MEEKKQAIIDFLNQEVMGFHEGLKLYMEHPDSKRNIVLALEKNHRHSSAHRKLVYKLEQIAGVKKFSGRQTVLKGSPQNVPFRIVKSTEKEAPKTFEYKTKLSEMPDNLKALVIEKGELYDSLDKQKKEIGAIGQKNDDASIMKRQQSLAEMQIKSNRIKEIHKILQDFDKTGKAEDVRNESTDDSTPEGILEHDYNFRNLNDAEKKLLVKKLQSDVAKQKARSETSKKEATRKKNADLAELNIKIIELIQADFNENTESEKLEPESVEPDLTDGAI